MSGASDIQVVVFGLGDEEFALPVATVREILDHRNAYRVPHAPDWFLGLTGVRGDSVPMVDLRVRLGLSPVEPTLTTRVLVVDVAGEGRVDLEREDRAAAHRAQLDERAAPDHVDGARLPVDDRERLAGGVPVLRHL